VPSGRSLAASRTSYFAALGKVLITGLVVALTCFLTDPQVLALVATFLATWCAVLVAVWVFVRF
jgi:hypothetical protein